MPLVTSCGALTPRLVIEHEVHYVYEPPYLQECKDEPVAPGKGVQNQAWGEYIFDLRDAGADCRDKVKKGKEWADEQRAKENADED